MNLYIRLLCLLVRIWFIKAKGLFEPSVISFRVMPWDCDINRHLTNARYPAFMDLARTHLMGQVKLLKPMLKRRWLPVLAGSDCSFLRPIKPLQKFEVVTRLLTWDEKYFYVEQRFEVKGKVCMLALTKGLFIASDGSKIKIDEFMQ